MDFGMPALIENRNLEETVSLCRELGLQFIELNMNFPLYQLGQLENTAYFLQLARENHIYFTIHLSEDLNVCDFNPEVAGAYRRTVIRALEAAEKIKAECPKVHIVLVTAYVNYALDGYKVKASRFLLKDDLEQTLSECVEDILREERVVEFGFVEGSVRLRVDDIIYIETSKHKNVFYTAGETYSIYKKMDELEAELAGMGFVRIHQSFLINMRYIGKLGSYVMVLTTGKEISVPKSRYPEVKRQYTLFKGAE